MYAMQYEISLPADYDMSIIRHRVASKGSALDTCPWWPDEDQRRYGCKKPVAMATTGTHPFLHPSGPPV
jgi:Domain of unknown function (DUF4865)